MAASPVPTKSSFFKHHVLPVLFIFLIPGFSAWFFPFAENRTDQDFLKSIESSVQRDNKLSAQERAGILGFYRAVPVSRIMASDKPEDVRMQPMFKSARTAYATFRWMTRIAWICLVTIGVTFLIVGLSVAFSFRSHPAQYLALRIGWPVLRTSAAIQVLGQAVMAVALSYWVTAIFAERYYVKLIMIIGILAAMAAFTLWKAIFAKVNPRCEVSGELVPEADAPALWRRVREMAAKLGTAAPDQIIVGIDATFFVTEHPVTLGERTFQGRTLFLSLPMLKVFRVEEADAVLGHELAHFSGQDTLWARKISPLTGKFAVYLQLLSNGLSLIIAHFMHFFWKLYGLSIHRLSRAREFRADKVGAELVSTDAMKRALVKTTAYCEYRNQTEMAAVQKSRVDANLNLCQELEQGYPAFLSKLALSERMIDERVPHPFDTHPTLNSRLGQLGCDAREAIREAATAQAAQDSWYHTIATAQAIEEKMWAEQQRALQSYHSQDLAWRLMPKDEEEAAIVREHFPRIVFRNKKGAEATLEFDRIHLAEWSAPILFNDISSASVEDAWMKKRLTITHTQPGAAKPAKVKFYPGLFTSEKGDLLTLFGHYYGRHKTAEARSREPGV